MVGDFWSKLLNVPFRSAAWQCFGFVIVPPVHLYELFSIQENKLIGYAGDSTLLFVGPSSGIRFTVAESLNRDHGKVSEWCDHWVYMKLNASKAKTMIVPRSRPMHHQSLPLTIGGTMLKESDDFDILGVTIDSKMTLEKQKHLARYSKLLEDSTS